MVYADLSHFCIDTVSHVPTFMMIKIRQRSYNYERQRKHRSVLACHIVCSCDRELYLAQVCHAKQHIISSPRVSYRNLQIHWPPCRPALTYHSSHTRDISSNPLVQRTYHTLVSRNLCMPPRCSQPCHPPPSHLRVVFGHRNLRT